MSEPRTARCFTLEYQKRQEQKFKDWCMEKGRPYYEDLSDPRRTQILNEYSEFNQIMEQEKRNEEAKAEKMARELEQVLREKEFAKSIPTRYLNASIRDFKMGDNANAILNGASALMLGNNGPGKTHFKWAVCREWITRGETVMVVKAQELLYDIKRRDDPYRYIREAFGRNAVHFVVDEVDKIFESKADFVYLNYLVDFRYEWCLQTFMIGNGDKNSFLAALGQSIFSRLTGDGGVYIKFEGKDRRQSA